MRRELLTITTKLNSIKIVYTVTILMIFIHSNLSLLIISTIENPRNLITLVASDRDMSEADLDQFIHSLIIAFTLCVIQLSLFCLLRPRFDPLYQPRCTYVPEIERVEKPGDGFFEWLIPTWNAQILAYLDNGLDAYFFLRFLVFLLLFFLCCGFLNMAILVPINLSTSKDIRTSILRRMSIHIPDNEAKALLNFHFVCAFVTISALHFLLIKETKTALKIRSAYMESPRYKMLVSSRVVLISGIPHHMRNHSSLSTFCASFTGNLKELWFVDDFREIAMNVREAQRAFELLERTESICLARGISANSYFQYPPYQLLLPNFEKLGLRSRFLLSSWVTMFMGLKKQPMRNWCITQIIDRNRQVNERLRKGEGRTDKAFLEFQSQSSARIANQCFNLSEKYFGKTITDVDPRDVIWSNLLEESEVVRQLKYFLIRIALLCAIGFSVLPVSVIGFFFQAVSHLISSINGVKNLPLEARSLIANVLPSLVLNIYTMCHLELIKSLLKHGTVWTGQELQLLLQRWYFVSLFVHQFLAVSISTSVTKIFLLIIQRPSTLPILLARNLPEAAHFFYRHLAVKVLAVCGADFLRIGRLLNELVIQPLTSLTPREKFHRSTRLTCTQWGLLYPILSLYGVIGVTYCVISPVITTLLLLVFFVMLIYYKYALQFVYTTTNPSETYGRLYFNALSLLYWGIYCLEFSIVGFTLNKLNTKLTGPTFLQRLAMIAALLLTGFIHSSVVSKYSKYFEYPPIVTSGTTFTDAGRKLSKGQLYKHPCYRWKVPKVWLPDDGSNLAGEALFEIEKLFSGNISTSFSGATVIKGRKESLRVHDGTH